VKVDSAWRDKQVVVTGGAGFIGSHLCERLVAAGARVTVIDDLSHGRAGNLESVIRDIRMVNHRLGDGIEPPAEQMTGDVLFHFAALADPRACKNDPARAHRLNVTATEELLKAWCGGRILFPSTASIYGDPKYLPIDEKHPPGPVGDPYAESKIAAERLFDRYRVERGLKSTIVRNFNLYGPRQSESYFVPTLVAQAIRDNQISIWNGRPVRDMTYIDDGVEALLAVAAADQALGETINLGSGRGTRMEDLARQVADLFGVPFVDQQKDVVGSRELVCDNSKLRRMTGWAPRTSLAEGVEHTVAHFRKSLGHGTRS
jgi:nucleoside-diphosphate-sugar epimerase